MTPEAKPYATSQPPPPDPQTPKKFCPFSWTSAANQLGQVQFIPADCDPAQCALGDNGRCSLLNLANTLKKLPTAFQVFPDK